MKTHQTNRNRSAGFSLIEVTLAISIVAFAFLSLIGMLPVGLRAFNGAVDATVEAQIANQLFAEAQQVKFANLEYMAGAMYFDEEGILVGEGDPPSHGFIYEAIVHPPESKFMNNTYVRTVLVEIARNRTVETLRNVDPSQIRKFTFIIADIGT